MSETPPAPRRPSGCTVLLGCLGAVVGAVYMIVHAVTAWMTGHPWTTIVVAAFAASGGTLGGWLSARRSGGHADDERGH